MWNKVLTAVLMVLVLITSSFFGYNLAESKKNKAPTDESIIIEDEAVEENKSNEQEDKMITDNGSAMLVAELEVAEKAAVQLSANTGDALQKLMDSEDNSMFNLFEVLPDEPRIRKWTNKIIRLNGKTVYANHPDDSDLAPLSLSEMSEYRKEHYPDGEV